MFRNLFIMSKTWCYCMEINLLIYLDFKTVPRAKVSHRRDAREGGATVGLISIGCKPRDSSHSRDASEGGNP